MVDLIIIGAGYWGSGIAIKARRKGMSAVILADAATEAIEATANNTEKPKKKSSTSKTKKESKMVAVKNPPKKPASPKANPKPAKTPTPKKPATGKPTAPPKKAEANGKHEPRGEVGKPHLRVLEAVAKAGRGLTRAEISEKTGINSGFTSILGHVDPTKREAGSLAAKGLLTPKVDDQDGKEVIVWNLTAAGKKLVSK